MQDHQKLKIVIVGAGLGGLVAALCLARDGHDVHLYERRQTFEPKGGGIMIRPAASRFLREWGLQEDMNKICDASGATVYRSGLNDQEFMRMKTITTFGGHPDWGTFREDTQRVFHKHAIAHHANIKFGVMVTDVSEDEDKAKIHLSNGEIVHADLVLAADGILSRLRPKIISNAPDPSPGWTTLYQFRVSKDEVLADPDARKLVQTTDLAVWMNQGGGGYIVGRFNSKLNRMSGAFGIPETDEDPRLWDENGDIDYVRNYFKDYHPTVTSLLQIAKRCDRWRVAEMPDLPEWTSPKRRLALLGDSAHAMFPDAAYGFSLIVEDVGVLSHLLKHHFHRGVPALMKIWQDVRQPRVNKIKGWAKANLVLFTKGTEAPEPQAQNVAQMSLDEVEPDMEADFRSPRFLSWAYGFDAVEDVENYLRGEDGAKL